MKYFVFFLVILGVFVMTTNPAYAMCAFDPENPFAPCNDTIGTLEYPKTPDEIIPAPLKQMNLGIKLGHIICDPDKYPVWNVHYKPACVYPDSEGELLTRGWAKLKLLLPAGPDPIKELEVMGQNVFSLRILGNYIVGDEKYPLSHDRKRELAWEYSQQYHPGKTYLEYTITPHQNSYNVGDKIQFDLLEWGNYSDCWNLNLKIIDVKNNPVYEDNSVKYCLEPDGMPGTFHSYSMVEDFEEFVCERPGYYRIEVSNGEIFSADILQNFVCLDHKPEPEPEPTSTTHQNLIDARNKLREIYHANASLGSFNIKDVIVGHGMGDGFLIVDILKEYYDSAEDRELIIQKIVDITGGNVDIEFNS
jgi:hypothetical protein